MINKRKMKNQDNHLIESWRSLRSNMHFIEKKKKKVVLFTSTIPMEGKTTVSTNYAMSVAGSGEKVLLIDCDIRRPRAHNSFKIKVEYGIANILIENKKIDDVILKGVVENLDILPSKPLNQDIDIMNFFLGKEIGNLLDKLKERYDLIILDTPPLAIATDAAVLSEYADGVVYVCGYNMVNKKKMLRAKKILDRAGANIYGVVVNKIEKNGYFYGEYDDYIYKHYDNYIEKDNETIKE